MSNILNDLYIRPLYYDALSGEFTPVTDPQRNHTLGRLMVATFVKGKEEFELGGGAWSYTPSWAPHITAGLDCDFESDIIMATGFRLKRDTGEKMYIFDESDTSSSSLFLSTPGKPDMRFDLNLGDDLANAKAAITQASQEYFS